MPDKFLERINDALKERVREKKMDEKEEIKLGFFSFMMDEAVNKVVKALGTLKLPTPEVTVNAPEVNVTVPEIKVPKTEVNIPPIKVPEAKVTVELPEMPKIDTPIIPPIKIPTPKVTVNVEAPVMPPIEIPEIVMPDEMSIKTNNPMPVVLHDGAGKPYVATGGGGSGGASGSSLQKLLGKSTENIFHNSGGVPTTYTKEMESNIIFPLTPGTISELRLRPEILNEQQESSREALDTVTSSKVVGQVFKASQDNINGIYLTLESAAAETTIDDIEEANDAALQTAWVKTGTNLAVLDTVIKSPNQSSTKSMKLMMDVLNDKWTFTKSAGSWDMTGATIEFDYYQTKESNKTSMTFSINDGTNTSVLTIAVPKALKNTWQHFSIPVSSFVGTATVATITNVFYQVTLVDKAGLFAYVDNVRFRPVPGGLTLELWDMGNSLPDSDGTKDYTTGTQYTELGDRGIGGTVVSSLNVSLQGGKRLYHISDFIAGVAKEIPTNTSLAVNNYYAIVLKYLDTDVTVYGADTTFGIDYYINGYAWKAETADNLVDRIQGASGSGAYSNLMFGVFSTQDVYATKVELKILDANEAEVVSSLNTDIFWFIEDTKMKAHVITNEHYLNKEHKEDLSKRPVFMEKGSKAEIYYNSGIDDTAVNAVFELAYLFVPPTVNG